MRALVEFGKTRRLRFISHLDLQRYMQTALRRTDLPIAYSQGFNPHPLIAFASALAMGHTSGAEVLDIRLREDVSEKRLLTQMRSALPNDLPVARVRLVCDSCPAMTAILCAADYEISLDGADEEEIGHTVRDFLARTEVFAMRKTKSGETLSDIRPMVKEMRSIRVNENPAIFARLALTEKATLKPDLLLRVLAEGHSFDAGSARIHRKALLKDINGEYLPLLEGFS